MAPRNELPARLPLVMNVGNRDQPLLPAFPPPLTRLLDRGDVLPCYDALANTEAARSLGMADGMQHSQALWLKSAEAALQPPAPAL